MNETNETFTLKTPLRHLIFTAPLALAGCSSVDVGRGEVGGEQEMAAARHIEIEVDDFERGLPCRVIDRSSSGSRDVLWHAEFERGFCQRKAEETRLVLQTKGWACRPLSRDDRRSSTALASPQTVAAWRCLEGLEPVIQPTAASPRIPTARPYQEPKPPTASLPAPVVRNLLEDAVERDLAAIGQEITEDSALSKAEGDLNDDGIDDAVAVLTRGVDRVVPHRMLMAYLRDGDDYNLIDVWILRPPGDRQSGQLQLAIEDGRVQLGDCCGDRDGPMTLVLKGRKLVHADGG